MAPAPEPSAPIDERVVETPVEVPPPLTRRQLLEQRRALEEALEQSRDAEPPAPLTRRQVVEQRRSESSINLSTFAPSLSAVAIGAAGLALVAAVAAQVYGGALGAAVAAADGSGPTGADRSTGTTTADQPGSSVDASVALAALQPGQTRTALPASLRAVSRSAFRPVLPGCDGRVTSDDYANGQMPADELCALTFAPGHHLRADAAVALARLNIAYRARFHQNLCLTDSYRSLASQASLAARKPGLAARPGTSEHGMGLAVDLCDGVQTYRSVRYDWMRANAPTFGWQNPAWAVPPSSREEPWHWEYVVGERRAAAAS